MPPQLSPVCGYGLAGGFAATAVGLSYAAGLGDHVTIATPAVVGHIAGAAAGGALLPSLGVAVGSLIRSELAGVIGALMWCLVLESIVGGDVTAVRPYLPYTAASTLGGTKLGAAAFGPGFSVSAQTALPFAAAVAFLAAIVAVVSVISSHATIWRDVT